MYEMAPIAESIPLTGAVEGLCDIAPTISDNSKEVHRQLEQTALLHGKPSNDCSYKAKQQLGNVLRSREIRLVVEACRSYTHFDGQLLHLAPYSIPASDAATPNKG